MKKQNLNVRRLAPGTSRRLGSMLKVDFRRALVSPMTWIMPGIALLMPVLILVMTSMMDGMVTVDRRSGVETTMHAFTNAWQIIGTSGGTMAMDMTAMVNINLVYMLMGVYLCLFISEDFRSGYAKNIFTVRERKQDYIASKTILGIVSGAAMLLAFFLGTVIGGNVAGLPFTLTLAGGFGLVMCMLSKIALMAVFSPMAVAACCFGKQRSWLSILLFLFAGMLLFMMIPMLTPLDAGVMNVGLCAAGGIMFCLGLGALSNMILRKADIL